MAIEEPKDVEPPPMEWLPGEPQFKRVAMSPVKVSLLCPKEGCKGELIFNGGTWMTHPCGYHHRCNVCNYGAAVMGKTYPTIEYV